MLKSHVIEVGGVFVGAAVQHSDGYRLVAVAPQLAPLNGAVAPTLQDTRRLAIRALAGSATRPGEKPPAVCRDPQCMSP